MKIDIILAGVGGQGILSIAAVIGEAALSQGLYMKQSEVHGMSQRGGDVQSNLRISDQAIHSDLIPTGKADLVLALEPMEALRYLSYLSVEGWLVSNSVPYVNIPNYPDQERLDVGFSVMKRKVILDVESIAREAGSVRAANMVLLGAASPFLKLDYSELEAAVRHIFGRKGEEVVELNLKALSMGKAIAEQVFKS
ncbi:MAG: indolepyruvate oxidoreductase subunit beta [Bacteroidales bacterium]|nr:indolepyruvate oxidoreductase subunit beta [Bacteroidales bacterium]MDD4641585.1 indolepyruvate oxidoreductase subunit beta [Bacteroidales bacterium]